MPRSSRRRNPDAVKAFGHEVKNAGKASPEGEGNWAKSSFDDLVQYNDGFRSNLIGTPQQIAERILALKDAGASLILLGFLHFQEEVDYFGKHVIPLVRELEARRPKAVAADNGLPGSSAERRYVRWFSSSRRRRTRRRRPVRGRILSASSQGGISRW